MFRGRSRHILDDKGRVAIPSRFKEFLDQRGEDCLVVTNYDSCLWAIAKKDWEGFEQTAAELQHFDPGTNSFFRYFVSGAEECPIKQGRIRIPQILREMAGLKKEVMLVGHLKLFEIWDNEKWEEEFLRSKEAFPAVKKEIPGLKL